MPYRLRMPAQIGDWLADLRGTEPLAAAEVGATVAALLDADEIPGPPMVVRALGATPPAVDPDELIAMAEARYDELFNALTPFRQQYADARSIHTATRGRLGVRADGTTFSEKVPFTEAELAAADRRAEEVMSRLDNWRHEVQAFGTRRDSLRARYIAAEAMRDIHAASLSTGTGGEHAQAELAAAEDDLSAAAAKLAALGTEADRLLRKMKRDAARLEAAAAHEWPQEGRATGPNDVAEHSASVAALLDPKPVTADVLELRADPLGADVRILFAIEPPDTVTVLALLEGKDVIQASRHDAVDVAGDLLTEIRADTQMQPTNESDEWLEYAGTAPFLHRFFAGDEEAVSARAAVLAEVTSLADLRRASGMRLGELAKLIGLEESQLWTLENGGVRSALVDEVADYVRALGGRLEVTAVVEGERQRLA